jgi:hypothetical protein
VDANVIELKCPRNLFVATCSPSPRTQFARRPNDKTTNTIGHRNHGVFTGGAGMRHRLKT